MTSRLLFFAWMATTIIGGSLDAPISSSALFERSSSGRRSNHNLHRRLHHNALHRRNETTSTAGSSANLGTSSDSPTQGSLSPIPVPTEPSSNSGKYFQPAIYWGNDSHLPSAWVPQLSQAYVFTPTGGYRDMSQHHPFIQLNVAFDGNHTGVDLEGTDGIRDIDCGQDLWQIRTKDDEHFNVAKQWPDNVILITSTFCQSGSSRRLLQVDRLSYEEPDIIIAHGKQSLFALAPPIAMVHAQFGHHKPALWRRQLNTPQRRTFRKSKRKSSHEKRLHIGNPLSDATSAAGGAASDIASGATGVASTAESAGTGVASTAESAGTGVATTAESAGTGVATTAESAGTGIATTAESLGTGLATTITSGAGSIYTQASSDIASLISKTFSAGTSQTIHIVPASPTADSPWGSPGAQITSYQGMELWDLGLQLSGGVEMEGDFVIHTTDVAQDGILTGGMGINGSEWQLDFPLGLNFQNANFKIMWDSLQIMEPIDLCPELGCFAIENVFELGSEINLVLNMTFDVQHTTGKLNLGTNITYPQPQANWVFGDHSKHSATGWEGEHKKWFDLSDGTVNFAGGLGIEIQQFNGISFPSIPNAGLSVSLSDGVSIVAHVSANTKGVSSSSDTRRKRNTTNRKHAKDILARELMKKDTCASIGGVDVSLDLEEQVVVQAGAIFVGTSIPIWATQIPLTSTCIK